MTTIKSPGVHVLQVASATRPIAGVGTSTAGFLGIVPDSLNLPGEKCRNVAVGTGNGQKLSFDLPDKPVVTEGGYEVRVNGKVVEKVTLENLTTKSKIEFDEGCAPATDAKITADYHKAEKFTPVGADEVVLCTNFSEFKKKFGDFTYHSNQRNLAHAVYGFFDNGGTRCYVTRAEDETGLIAAPANFEPIDEIAIVAAPGITSDSVRAAMVTHCAEKTGDRFAIFDCPEEVTDTSKILPAHSEDAAIYYPWLQVFNPLDPETPLFVPPSGHIAGIYARVDAGRGVHKAPANEVVLGALGLKYAISRADQDGLNPDGINCIRKLHGNIRVWGARTVGGDDNGEWKYVNIRRLFLFLRESIDKGTQWAVFEPNEPGLWARITRNVTAFLTNVWRAGALFGSSPAEAFYVKCDAETNPPEAREQGRLVTEIGVAMVKPAEFVIFRLSQWAGPEA